VITNATLLTRPEVAETLRFLDAHRGEVWAKLDAGTEEYYRRIERTKVPLERVLANILGCGRERAVVVQSLFMRVDGVGPPAEEIAAYVARLRDLVAGGCRIASVQVYTTARTTAEANVSALADAELDAIATRVRGLGLAAEAFYGATPS
jgi:wyosine [tRNA(Phe)-imidazoG37] synthetase (radical SAM superfamily)